MYYESIYPGGDPSGRKEAYVTAIRPNEYFKLILSTGDMITGTMNVKRLKTALMSHVIEQCHELVFYWCLFCTRLAFRLNRIQRTVAYMRPLK